MRPQPVCNGILMRITALFKVIGLMFLFVLDGQTQAAPTAPDQLITNLFNESIARVKQEKEAVKKDHNRLIALGEEIVVPYVSFEKMSKQILGKYWRTITPDQQSRFTLAFKQRVSMTLVERYDADKEWTLKILGSKTSSNGKIAFVNSEITDVTAAQKYLISYRFFMDPKSGKWMVFDVIVEGVSVLSSFQTAAAEEMRRGGIEKLISQLEKGELKTDSGDKSPKTAAKF